MVTSHECNSKHRNLNYATTSIILVLTIISGFVLAAKKDGSDANKNVNKFKGEVTEKINNVENKFDKHEAAGVERDKYIVKSLDEIKETLNEIHPREGG